jgi:hypothetical protein
VQVFANVERRLESRLLDCARENSLERFQSCLHRLQGFLRQIALLRERFKDNRRACGLRWNQLKTKHGEKGQPVFFRRPVQALNDRFQVARNDANKRGIGARVRRLPLPLGHVAQSPRQ